MSSEITFTKRLLAVLVPTKGQAVGSILIAALLMVIIRSGQVIKLLGFSDSAIMTTQSQIHDRVAGLLGSPIASGAALVTFWAGVGLVAYLVCWGGYNLLIEARNEVTLTTMYTNKGHWRSPIHTLVLKGLGALALIATFALLKPGLALWLALVDPVVSEISVLAVLMAVLAVIGLATQLYLILAFVIFTLTPWYRVEAFTER